MTLVDTLLDRLGRRIAGRIEMPCRGYEPFTPSDPITLHRMLRPADVLLVEGNQKLATAIKYLTQSTWSHAALYVGDALGEPQDGKEVCALVEANVGEGVIAVPLSKYVCFNTRICRPVGLTAVEQSQVVHFMVERIGYQYDMRNIIDLARFLLPLPPVPVRWRRRMIALGSGEPTRAICSTLIAQAFQSVRYPILPRIERVPEHVEGSYGAEEILHIRHHSLLHRATSISRRTFRSSSQALMQPLTTRHSSGRMRRRRQAGRTEEAELLLSGRWSPNRRRWRGDRRASPVDPTSRSLVTMRVSQINDCAFCVGINSATLLKRA